MGDTEPQVSKIPNSRRSYRIVYFIIFIFVSLALLSVVFFVFLYFSKRLPCASRRDELGLVKSDSYEYRDNGVTTWKTNACVLDKPSITDDGVRLKIGFKKNSFQMETFNALVGGKDGYIGLCVLSENGDRNECKIMKANEIVSALESERFNVITATIIIEDNSKVIVSENETTSSYKEFIGKLKAFLLEGKRIKGEKQDIRLFEIRIK